MKPEFMIERSGRTFVLFAGLLDTFHTRFVGSKSITTELLQPPHDMNGNVAIVKARVEATDEEGNVLVFEDVGDASAGNVGKNIAPHIIRMASTRAKARALRDAINVGVTAFEEIGGDDGNASPGTEPTSISKARSGSRPTSKPKQDLKDDSTHLTAKASEAQVRAITGLVEAVHGLSLAEYEEDYLENPVAEMNPQQATALHKSLTKEKREIEEADRA